MKNIATTAFVFATIIGTVLAAPQTGQPAPEFTLTDSNGKSHKLSDFKGKFVVLEWLNHGCPFVVKHYGSGNMQRLQKEYTGKDVVWLSIASSASGKQGHMSPEETNKTKEEKGSSATAVLLDEENSTMPKSRRSFTSSIPKASSSMPARSTTRNQPTPRTWPGRKIMSNRPSTRPWPANR
jgi:hypothetical protein